MAGGEGVTDGTTLIQSHSETEPFSKRQDIGVAIYEVWTRVPWAPDQHLTDDEIGQINKTIEALPPQARPHTVHTRAEEWRRRHPDATLTPKALRSHWSSLATPNAGCRHKWELTEVDDGYRYTCTKCEVSKDLEVA